MTPSASARRKAYEAYIASPEWQKRRKQALIRAGQRCQVCNAGGQLHVHHRTYTRFGREDASDLTVLCAECHRLFHGRSDRAAPTKLRKKRGKHRRARASEVRIYWERPPGEIECELEDALDAALERAS